MLYKGGRQLRSIEVGKLLISRFDPACVPCFSFVTTVPYYSMGTARLLFTYTCHPGLYNTRGRSPSRSGSLLFCGWEGGICPSEK